jgi:SAM-dependent methyltransferase
MGQSTEDSWCEEDNPRRYDAYARAYPNYRETSQDLIAVALPSADAALADAAVLDLCCGTGATTREILAVLGPGGSATGVDRSAAMLKVAASSTADSRASWVQAPAERVDQHMAGPVDVVICNSAIWQTDTAATALAVRAVLRAGGCFACNVPTGQSRISARVAIVTDLHPRSASRSALPGPDARTGESLRTPRARPNPPGAMGDLRRPAAWLVPRGRTAATPSRSCPSRASRWVSTSDRSRFPGDAAAAALAATAAGAAAAAPAGGGHRGWSPSAAEGDRGQQLDGVVVPARAGCGRR